MRGGTDRRRWTSVVAGWTALLAAGLPGVAAHGAPTRSGPGDAAIAWAQCSDRDLRRAGAQCGFLQVPLDWARPDARTIRIAVSRIRARVPERERRGVMVGNPGGPGGSGLNLALLGDLVPGGIGDRYDWIGFDPRGVGASRPALGCDPSYFTGRLPDYRPTGRALPRGQEISWIAKSRAYARACGRRHGDLLEHMKTVDTVRDLEAIRLALDAPRLGFYGYSYGSLLGQVYATLFPDRTGPMVLDGNIAPDGFGYQQGSRVLSIAIEGGLAAFWRWTARRHERFGLGHSAAAVQRRYYRVENALRLRPRGSVGPSEWNDLFLLAAYADLDWPGIARAFAAWERGVRAPARALIRDQRAGGDNEYAAFLALLCSDDAWPRLHLQVREDSFATEPQAPFAVWNTQWYTGPCTYWPARQGVAPVIDGGAAPPILLINTTGDAVTPFAGALAVRREFPRAVLVAEVGSTSHAKSLTGNRCVDGAIAAYLRDGSLPARRTGNRADLRCPGTPPPR
ncbi:MAG: alpha/beta hydrolase [Sporichthyaceae bacterium]